MPAHLDIMTFKLRHTYSVLESQRSLSRVLIGNECQTSLELRTVDQFEADDLAKSCKDPSAALVAAILGQA